MKKIAPNFKIKLIMIVLDKLFHKMNRIEAHPKGSLNQA